MIKNMNELLLTLATRMIRCFPVLVVMCLMIVPAYKGIWLGYVPVGIGLGVAVILMSQRDKFMMRLDGWNFRQHGLFLYVIPAALQMLLLRVFQPVPSFDGLFVLRHAEILAATGQMDPLTYYPPAQTWWYAGWFHLLGVSTWVAQWSQIPLSLGVTWATFRLGRSVTASPAAARMAALVVAWYPSFLAYVLTTPYYHYLYTLFTVLMTWGVVRGMGAFPSSRSPVMFGPVLAGMAAGAGALTKAVQLIAPLQVVTWLVVLALMAGLKQIPWRTWAMGLTLFILGMAAVVGPWTYRNATVFDAVVPVCTSGGLVLYSANNPTSNGMYSGLPDQVTVETPAEMLAHSRWCSAQAKQFMREEPRAFLRLVGLKFLHTWGVEATFTELINWRGQPRAWIKPGFSFLFMLGWATIVFGWLGASMQWMRQRARLGVLEAWVGVLILSNAVVYVLFEGGDRHHLPLVPLVVVMVLAGNALTNRRGEVDGTSSPADAGPEDRPPR